MTKIYGRPRADSTTSWFSRERPFFENYFRLERSEISRLWCVKSARSFSVIGFQYEENWYNKPLRYSVSVFVVRTNDIPTCFESKERWRSIPGSMACVLSRPEVAWADDGPEKSVKSSRTALHSRCWSKWRHLVTKRWLAEVQVTKTSLNWKEQPANCGNWSTLSKPVSASFAFLSLAMFLLEAI